MKFLVSTFSLILFLFSTTIIAQDNNFQCEGAWQIKGNASNFCNIIMLSNVEGESQPIAVIEGVIDDKVFSVKCVIEEIPHRKSIVFRKVSSSTSKQVALGDERPLLILVTNNKLIENVIWGQMDLTKSKSLKGNGRFRIKKTAIPDYRAKYQFTTANSAVF